MSLDHHHKGPGQGMVIGAVVGLLLAMLGACFSTAGFFFNRRRNRFTVATRAAEAKSNLKALFTAQRSYFLTHGVYAQTLEKTGFVPQYNNRYLYLLSAHGDLLVQRAPDGGEHAGVFADENPLPPPDNQLLLSSIPPSLLSEVGVTCDDDGGCEVTAVAIANNDRDATLDLWSVSTKTRVLDGVTVSPGVPFNHVNDADH